MANGAQEYSRVTVELVKARSKAAALIVVEGEEHWVPYSLIHEEDLMLMEPNTKDVDVNIKAWFVKREGLQ